MGITVWLKGVVVPNSPMVRGWWVPRCGSQVVVVPAIPRSGKGCVGPTCLSEGKVDPQAVRGCVWVHCCISEGKVAPHAFRIKYLIN